ncbi:hypothetical protein ACLB2K_050674 [Fragaria x ananassa]
MAPFEALYGKQCRTPLCWNEVGERELCGPEIIHDINEKIKVVRDRLKAAQSRQKSYADVRKKDFEFQVGDWVFLKLSPWKGVVRFGKRGKLSSRYIGAYEIIERVGSLAYRVKFGAGLDTFRTSYVVCAKSFRGSYVLCLKACEIHSPCGVIPRAYLVIHLA